MILSRCVEDRVGSDWYSRSMQRGGLDQLLVDSERVYQAANSCAEQGNVALSSDAYKRVLRVQERDAINALRRDPRFLRLPLENQSDYLASLSSNLSPITYGHFAVRWGFAGILAGGFIGGSCGIVNFISHAAELAAESADPFGGGSRLQPMPAYIGRGLAVGVGIGLALGLGLAAYFYYHGTSE